MKKRLFSFVAILGLLFYLIQPWGVKASVNDLHQIVTQSHDQGYYKLPKGDWIIDQPLYVGIDLGGAGEELTRILVVPGAQIWAVYVMPGGKLHDITIDYQGEAGQPPMWGVGLIIQGGEAYRFTVKNSNSDNIVVSASEYRLTDFKSISPGRRDLGAAVEFASPYTKNGIVTNFYIKDANTSQGAFFFSIHGDNEGAIDENVAVDTTIISNGIVEGSTYLIGAIYAGAPPVSGDKHKNILVSNIVVKGTPKLVQDDSNRWRERLALDNIWWESPTGYQYVDNLVYP